MPFCFKLISTSHACFFVSMDIHPLPKLTTTTQSIPYLVLSNQSFTYEWSSCTGFGTAPIYITFGGTGWAYSSPNPVATVMKNDRRLEVSEKNGNKSRSFRIRFN